jgi:hypothetical protein
MRITLADKVVAYLALISGLTISAVAIWYSVAGLVSIFAAAVVPIIVMGVVLEVSKLIATVWLKLNWHRAPIFIRTYLLIAIAILMVITSMGIFGFLSKAHSDAGLVSGDVQARIAIYDEKIKTAKENIDANRKALKQMDEAVDQVMARSSSETGADKAVGLRRSQLKERARLQSEIQAEQKTISALSEERAPIAAEVRKVEAEVGPIKYIANFIYGDNPDANILEKAVTWVIIIIVAVFDPLAVILLLASQYSFQWFRQSREEQEHTPDTHVTDVGVKPNEELNDSKLSTVEELAPEEKSILSQHPYLSEPFVHFKDLQPMVYKPETVNVTQQDSQAEFDAGNIENIPWEEVEALEDKKANPILESVFPEKPTKGMKFRNEVENRNYIYNGNEWINYDLSDKDALKGLEKIAEEESKKKNFYMIKDQDTQIKKAKE